MEKACQHLNTRLHEKSTFLGFEESESLGLFSGWHQSAGVEWVSAGYWLSSLCHTHQPHSFPHAAKLGA